jgi:uncharacterized protein (TIGR03083 family)
MEQPATPEDVVLAYQGVRSRTLEILGSLSEAQATQVIPACPAWTIRDLTCHLYGVIDDIFEGRLHGAGSDPWTAAQVARYGDWTLAQLCDAWEASAERFDAVLLAMPSPTNLRIVMDQLTHEHDLRHALGRFGAQDSDAIALGTTWLVQSLVGGDVSLAEQLRRSEASPFEIFRALGGRRSVRQLNALGFPGEDFAARMQGSPISVPAEDFIETVAPE